MLWLKHALRVGLRRAAWVAAYEAEEQGAQR